MESAIVWRRFESHDILKGSLLSRTSLNPDAFAAKEAKKRGAGERLLAGLFPPALVSGVSSGNKGEKGIVGRMMRQRPLQRLNREMFGYFREKGSRVRAGRGDGRVAIKKKKKNLL